MGDHLRVALKLYCTNILRFIDEEGDGRLGLSRSDGDAVSDDWASNDECRFLNDLEDIHTPLAPDVVIDSFDGQRVATSPHDFFFVTSRKYRNTRK